MQSIFDFGYIYDIILLMLFISGCVDIYGLAKVVKGSAEDKKEYAEEIIRWFKLVMYVFAGGWCIYLCTLGQYDMATCGIHIGIAVLLAVDLCLSLYIKIRYRR